MRKVSEKVRNDPFAEGSDAVCRRCGITIGPQQTYCNDCSIILGNHPSRVKEILKEGERGTFVETTVAGTPEAMEAGAQYLAETQPQPMSTYTRIADLTPSLDLVSLEDLSNVELFVWRFDEHKGTPDMGPFLTLECSTMNNAEHRFLTNCGGVDVMRKIKNAFEAVDAGRALPPLAARFHKIRTQSGNAFWVIS